MLTSGLSQPIISPKDTWLHRQNVGSLGSIGMSASSNAPVKALVSTATLATLLVGFDGSETALPEGAAFVFFLPPEKY